MTKTATVELKNCYGIDALTHTFDFSNNNMPVIVYAPNGVMKTSLAKTLCQSALKFDPLSASNIDPLGGEQARRCVALT